MCEFPYLDLRGGFNGLTSMAKRGCVLVLDPACSFMIKDCEEKVGTSEVPVVFRLVLFLELSMARNDPV